MKKLLLLIPLIAFIIGCGGEEASYWPLAVGNEWHYTTIQTTTTPDTVMELTGTQDVEITSETTLDNGIPVFESVATISWDDTLMPDLIDTVFIEETDEYILSYDTKDDYEPDTNITLPIEDGNTWTVHDDTLYTITAIVLGQENITVPAGTYEDCWKIAYVVDDNDTTYNYFAADVGNVRCEHTMQVDSVTTETVTQLQSTNVQ